MKLLRSLLALIILIGIARFVLKYVDYNSDDSIYNFIAVISFLTGFIFEKIGGVKQSEQNNFENFSAKHILLFWAISLVVILFVQGLAYLGGTPFEFKSFYAFPTPILYGYLAGLTINWINNKRQA